MDFGSLFTSTQARINRAKWWVGMIVLAIANFVLTWVLILMLGPAAAIALLVLQLILFYRHTRSARNAFRIAAGPGLWP